LTLLEKARAGVHALGLRAYARAPAIWLYIVSTSSLLGGVVAQSVGLVIVARFLGNENYGRLAMITAVGSVLASWVLLGSNELMRRHVTKHPEEYALVLGHSLILVFGMGAVFAATVAGVLSQFLTVAPDPLSNYICCLLLVAANVVLYPWTTIVEQVFLVHNRFGQANAVNFGFGMLRALTAAVACIGFGVHNVSAWAVWNFGAYALGGIVGAVAIASYGAPRFGVIWREIPVGVTFGISGFMYNLRANVDVLSLGIVAPPEVVATYSLARRVVNTAVIVGASLDRLVYSKLVQAGRRGVSMSFSLAQRYAVYALVLTGAVAMALFIGAPFYMPILFGKTYAGSALLVRYLCGIVVTVSLQNVAFDALNAADLHRFQTKMSVVTVLAGSAAIFALTYRLGLPGVVLGVYLSELALTLVLWAGLARVSRSGPRGQRAAEPSSP